MTTNRRNHLARLGMAAAFILTASPMLTRLHAAQLLTPSISTSLGFGPAISPPSNAAAPPGGTLPERAAAQPLPFNLGRSNLAFGPGITPVPTLNAPPTASQPTADTKGGSIYQGRACYLALELGGKFIGWLDSVEGGDPVGQLNDKIGAGKLLAGVRFEEITLRCGTVMEKEFYDWLNETLTANERSGISRKTGAVVVIDNHANEEVSRLSFADATISEIDFPPLDASSSAPVELTVKLVPLGSRWSFNRAPAPRYRPAPDRRLLANIFRLSIIDSNDGVRASKVSGLKVKRATNAGPFGAPGNGLLISNLSVTFAGIPPTSLQAWFDSFVMNQQCDLKNEKQGSLQLFRSLSSGAAELTLSFKSLGILRLGPERAVTQANDFPNWQAEMRCGEIRIGYTNANEPGTRR